MPIGSSIIELSPAAAIASMTTASARSLAALRATAASTKARAMVSAWPKPRSWASGSRSSKTGLRLSSSSGRLRSARGPAGDSAPLSTRSTGRTKSVDRLQITLGHVEVPQVVPAEMAPDQAERAVWLAVVAQRRVFLVVIEDEPGRIMITSDVIDHPVRRGSGPSLLARPHNPRLRIQPRQDDRREKLVGVETTGMGNAMGDGHGLSPKSR